MAITIQIKEAATNNDADTNKNINLRIVGEGLAVGQVPVWSFISVTNPSSTPVLHSVDAEEGTFLNYSSPMEPTMCLVLPEAGTYTIKGVAMIYTETTGDVKVYEVNEAGEPVESTVQGIITTPNYIESSELVLEVSSNNATWV